MVAHIAWPALSGFDLKTSPHVNGSQCQTKLDHVTCLYAASYEGHSFDGNVELGCDVFNDTTDWYSK